MTNLRIENLTKKYGNIKALDDFSLEVKSGEFMVILRPPVAERPRCEVYCRPY